MPEPLGTGRQKADTVPGIYALVGEFAHSVGAHPDGVVNRIAAGEDLLVSAERVFDALAYRAGHRFPCAVGDYDKLDAPDWLVAVARHAPEYVVDDLDTNTIRCAQVVVARNNTIRPDMTFRQAAWW